MRVLIIGAVSGNGGDAAILLAQVSAIQAAAAPEVVEVDVIDYNPGIARRMTTGLDRVISFDTPTPSTGPKRSRVAHKVLFVVNRARRVARRRQGQAQVILHQPLPLPREEALTLIAEADVCLYTGGTSLVENYDLHQKLGYLRTSLLMGKPLVLGTQSLGPFTHPDHVEAVRAICDRADAVLLREERSLGHLEAIGADVTRAELLPDVVFSLAPELTGARQPARRLRVAVSVRPWTHFQAQSAREGKTRYQTAIRELVTWLVRSRDADVVFVSTCQGLPDYWVDDSKTATEIAKGLPDEVAAKVEVVREHRDPARLLADFRDFDLVVATRMHAAILALSARTPVLAIAYEFKSLELFASLGRPELAIDIEVISGASLVAAVERWEADREDIQLTIDRTVAEWRIQAGRLGHVVVGAAHEHRAADGGAGNGPVQRMRDDISSTS